MAEPSVTSTVGQIPDDEAWHRTIILPQDILDNRPSGNYDVEWEDELAHRIWGCELIQEAGILLRYPILLSKSNCTGCSLVGRLIQMTNYKEHQACLFSQARKPILYRVRFLIGELSREFSEIFRVDLCGLFSPMSSISLQAPTVVCNTFSLVVAFVLWMCLHLPCLVRTIWFLSCDFMNYYL